MWATGLIKLGYLRYGTNKGSCAAAARRTIGVSSLHKVWNDFLSSSWISADTLAYGVPCSAQAVTRAANLAQYKDT